MGRYDDLIPQGGGTSGGRYDDLIPGAKIPKSETFMDKALGAMKSANEFSRQLQYGATNTASFGLLGAMRKASGDRFGEPDPKTIAGSSGRLAGDVGGFIAGGPGKFGKVVASRLPKLSRFGKGAVEAGVGTASLSPSELYQGSEPSTEAMKIGGLSALGGASEVVPNALMKGLFRKNIKRTKMDSLISDIGKVKESIRKDPNATVDTTDLWTKLTDIYEGLAEPVRGEARHIKRWIDYLEVNPTVHADKILQMERELGSTSKFGGTKGGFLQFLKPKSPVANEATKAGRTAASEAYDKVAGPEFATKSKKISSIAKRYPDLDPSVGARDFGERVAYALLGKSVTGSNLASFIAYEFAKALQLPEVRQAVYKGITGKGSKMIGKGLKKTAIATPATQI